MPFRQAHHAVGRLVAIAEKHRLPLHEIPQELALTADPAFTKGWQEVFNLTRAFQSREKIGMPGPRTLEREIKRWQKALR